MAKTQKKPTHAEAYSDLDKAIGELSAAKDDWAQSSTASRIALLSEIRDRTYAVAKGWAETAARKKTDPRGIAFGRGRMAFWALRHHLNVQ